MDKDKLITKQQLEIERLRGIVDENTERISTIKRMFIGIGMPLNDNNLKFTDKQLGWCSTILEMVEELNTVPGEDSSYMRRVNLLDRFKNGKERYMTDPVFGKVINLLSRGTGEYEVMDMLMDTLSETKEAFQNYLVKDN